MKKRMSILLVAALTTGVLTACGGGAAPDKTTTMANASTEAGTTAGVDATEKAAGDGERITITVGVSPAPHAEIINAAKEILAEEGYNLVVKEYVDYIQPNLALDAGDLDANYFQHFPYLDEFNKEKGTKLVSAAAVHYEPLGIYAGKTATLEELAEGAKIAVPNDATNEARALLLLESQGLITLKEGAGITATKNDIVTNEKKFDIVEIEAAQIPRSLADVDAAVINGNYALEAGLKVSDALASEDAASVAAQTYGNIVAIQEGRESDTAIIALVNALNSDEIKDFIVNKYEGAVVPLN